MSPAPTLSLRSYGRDGRAHQHAHVQIVLPLRGELEIEVGGRGSRLDAFRAAVIAPHTRHAQSAHGDNRFLVLDCATAAFDDAALERLQRAPFLDLPPDLQRLLASLDPAQAADRDACAALALQQLRIRHSHSWTRLQALCRRIEDAPGQPWPVQRMAETAHLSVSRLHALFREALGRTPQDWLSARRLDWVRRQLAHGAQPIAQLALDSGYADQSALTRALRRATGQTPAAYRRRHRAPPASPEQ
ncbi:AraC family transcriptional regulator [Xanthomonas sp. NCPPB 2654]|uniref:helix-turn-helix domain-containing protein n=1 Tax=unclassified Xanthomonas TaxID=2643310 RepID=UPI0021E033B8|nr:MULTISPECIES: AraC family transcriptional regulator [unclassified Xanthomonas]MDL5367454.1 AraC family transcriptional regulator [Xanthomonas sp. NCPPB 2654]UYC21679.1 AraC family transcriptional regulator [Xanthomonas sp. CFBP 8443]